MSQTITLSFPQSDIAVLTLDMPDKGANILSSSVLDELASHLDELEGRNDLNGLVIISGKPSTFIAGADLREFAASLDIAKETTVQMCRRGQTLFGRLSKCPFVTIAAIDGICVGGGAELAVWCDRRILSSGEKTEFGFPEVKLGLFPGWGGTARLPRIIGLSNAIEMITGGDSIDSAAAAVAGLADDVVPPEDLLDAAIAMIQDELQTKQYLSDREARSGPVEMNETELGFLGVTASAMIRQQTKGHYPAPMAALELMMETSAEDIDTACQMEAEGMADLFGSPINAALLNVFFLQDRVKKDTGIDREDVTPQPVAQMAVIGAGIMGAGIAAANVKRGVSVLFNDMSSEALAAGAKNVLTEAAYNRQTKQTDPDKLIAASPLLNLCTALDELRDCDLVVEAVIEDEAIKKKLFGELETHVAETAILASNTSTIPISKLASDLQHPERFCGIHFFNPVRRMKLVEVIRGEATSDSTVATAVAYAKRIGKLPIVVNDGPGFLVNRLLFPYMNESLQLLEQGVPIKNIERAAKAFGMPLGPIELYDMVGLDTAVYAGKVIWEAFPERIVASPILPALVKLGRLGKKSGKGFYSYENKKGRAEPDPEIASFLQDYVRKPVELSQEQITTRLFVPMLLEATRALDEGIVRNVRDVDFGLIFGLGFPPFRGGLLCWADSVGSKQMVETLKTLEEYGKRMEPTPMLLEMAEADRKFYD